MTSFQKAPRIVWPREGLSSAIEKRTFTRKRVFVESHRWSKRREYVESKWMRRTRKKLDY